MAQKIAQSSTGNESPADDKTTTLGKRAILPK